MFGIGKKLSVFLLILLFAGNSLAADVKTSKVSGKPPTAEMKKSDTGYVVSAEAVLKNIRDKQDVVLVDIRNKAEFEKFRIPDSINIPLFAVKTKDFLKSKSLILINEGYNQTQLRQACEELNAAGFRASFIYGGLNAWKENRGLIEGDPFAQQELNKIKPLDFLAEKDDDNRIIIDVSSSDTKNNRSLLPKSLHIPYQKDENNFVSAFQRELAKQKDKPFSSVLIVSQNGDQYENIQKAVRKADVKNVFFLRGGIEAYQKFSDEQKVIRQEKDASVKTKKCSRCQ